MKKLLIALLCAGLMVSSFAGCGGGGGGSSAPAADNNAPAADNNAPAADNNAPAADNNAPAADAGDAAGDADAADVNDDGTVNNPEAVKVDENKLVFWSLFSGGDGGFMDQIIADYNATSPTKQVQSIMLVWADYYTKLSTAVAANKGPDIGVSHQSRLAELRQNGVIVPVDDAAAAAGVNWGNFGQVLQDGVTFEGEKYAVPLDVHAEILYYNKDLLEKAGIPLEADGSVKIADFADFKAMLAKAKDANPDGTAFSLPMTGDDPWRMWWANYFQVGGTPILNDAGDQVTMDKAAAVKAAEDIYSLYQEGLIQAGIEDHQKYFQGGSAVFELGGTWAIGVYEGTDGFNYGGMTYPKFYNNQSSYADMHTFILPFNKSRDEADTNASMEFINYATSTGENVWAQSGQIVSNTEILNSDTFNSLPNRAIYKATADNAVFAPLTPYYGAIKDIMIKCCDTIWSGQTDATTAIDDMYSQIETAIL